MKSYLLLAVLATAPAPLWAQCVSSLTYSPAQPTLGQEITFTYTLSFAPRYTPPPNAFAEQYFGWNTYNRGFSQQSGPGEVVDAPGSISFQAMSVYAGFLTADASSQQAYAFGVPPACPGSVSGVGSLNILILPNQSGSYDNNNAPELLQGQYAFQFVGSTPELLPTNKVVAVGSFTADGQGNITSGVEDLNSAVSSQAAVPILSGTYTMNGASGSVEIVTTLGKQHFDIFYPVNTPLSSGTGPAISSATLITTDATPLGSGTLTKQSLAGQPSASLSEVSFVNLQGTAPANAGLRSVLTPATLAGLVYFNGGAVTSYLDVSSSETGVQKGIYENGTVGNPDANGRFTYTLSSGVSGFKQPTHFVGYMAGSQFFTISLDDNQKSYLFSGTGTLGGSGTQ